MQASLEFLDFGGGLKACEKVYCVTGALEVVKQGGWQGCCWLERGSDSQGFMRAQSEVMSAPVCLTCCVLCVAWSNALLCHLLLSSLLPLISADSEQNASWFSENAAKMLRQIAQHAVSGHAAVCSQAAAALCTWTHRSWLPRQASSQQQHRQMSGAVEDVTSFVKEVRLHQQESSRAGGTAQQTQLTCSTALHLIQQAMEILDIPEKLQQAILNPDKRLTVDLRVGTAAVSRQSTGPRAQFSSWAVPVPTVCLRCCCLPACMQVPMDNGEVEM